MALSASIGAAFFPSDASDADDLLIVAEQAMLTAKAAGGGYFVPHSMETADDAKDEEGHEPVGTKEHAAPASRLAKREENRRAEHRDRVLRRGRIVLGDGYSTIDCLVRDLSPSGARVSVQQGITIPQTVALTLLDTGRAYSAIRRWQRGLSIGFEFQAEEGKKSQHQAA